jgi:hypothetical protein
LVFSICIPLKDICNKFLLPAWLMRSILHSCKLKKEVRKSMI